MKARNYRRVKGIPYVRMEYIHGAPQSKIVKFTMGKLSDAYTHKLSLLARRRVQIRHNALEAARIAANRYLQEKLGKNFFLRILLLPHVVLRENKMIFGAHADRLQDGMRKAFGKPVGRAARVEPDQPVAEVYVYKNGIYVPEGETLIKKEIQREIDEEASNYITNEVLGHIKRATLINREDIEEHKHLIALKNGVFDLSTFELKEFSPDYYLFNKLPVEYDPNADCPKIKEFLKQVMSEDDITIFQEFLGYILYRDMPFHKALMLVGEGGTGKSTLIKVIERFLGDQNFVSISLHDLHIHRFAIADLYNKLANLFADLSSEDLRRTHAFKILTSGDTIRAEKKFKGSFYFRNTCKLVFSANQLPRVREDTDAYFRRWIIINFPNKFEEGKNAIPNYWKELSTKEELSGLFNFAVEGLKRLLMQNGFSYSKTTEETREEYIRKSDSVKAFIMDCIMTDAQSYIRKKLLYNVYVEYCKYMKYPAVSESTFFRKFISEIPVTESRIKFVEGRERVYNGVRFNQEFLDKIYKNSNNVHLVHEVHLSFLSKSKNKKNDQKIKIIESKLDSGLPGPGEENNEKVRINDEDNNEVRINEDEIKGKDESNEINVKTTSEIIHGDSMVNLLSEEEVKEYAELDKKIYQKLDDVRIKEFEKGGDKKDESTSNRNN